MTLEQFWQLIEQSRRAIDPNMVDGNIERQDRELAVLLSALPPDEAVSFNNHFQERLFHAYDWTLWAAAYLIGEGCSDDGFTDFRCWLISMGREVYERALEDPDSLADVVPRPEIETFFYEGFPEAPRTVYQQKTGRQIPRPPLEHPRTPTGTRREDNDAAPLSQALGPVRLVDAR